MSIKSRAKDVDEVLAFIQVLKCFSRSSEFRGWLKRVYRIGDSNSLFEGYRFLVVTVLRCLIESIALDRSLGLKEDYVFYRAGFEGVVLEDTPNTCEKTIFLKNIWALGRRVRRAKNWGELDTYFNDLYPLFQAFDNINAGCVQSRNGIDKADALRFVTQFYTFVFLNDIGDGVPHGYKTATITSKSITSQYLQSSFKGYAYSLEYLWSLLLTAEEFNKSCVRTIHESSTLYAQKAMEHINSEVNSIFFSGRKEYLLELKEWIALDTLFGCIRDEIIFPLEKRIGGSISFHHVLTVSKPCKNHLKSFLSKMGLSDPDYLTKTDDQSLEKFLDYTLLWYRVNVLDTQNLHVFNGVSAFISNLMGSIKLREYYKNKDKVLVRVFKHPLSRNRKDGYNYSYGICIQSFGTSGISDFSGWLIFYDCATDYSGFGGSLYAQAKFFIDKFKKESRLDIKEIVIDKEFFRGYLTRRSISSVFDRIIYSTPLGVEEGEPSISELQEEYELKLSEIQKNIEAFTGNTKGKLFEYVVHKWLMEGGSYKHTRCDFVIESEQIDCCGWNDDQADLYECKIACHVDSKDEIVDKLSRKSATLSKKSEVKVTPFVVFYYPIPQEQKNYFEGGGIQVIDDFRRKIMEDRLVFDRIRKPLLDILDL